VMGNSGSPFFGSGALVELARTALFLLFLGGAGT